MLSQAGPSRAVLSVAVVAATLAGCNEPAGPDLAAEFPSEISFQLDGQSYQGEHVSGSLLEGAFHITAADYVGFGHLMFWVNDWPGGGGTFHLTGSDGRRGMEYVASGQLSSAGATRFSTARHGGSGRITLDSAPVCVATTETEPGMGMAGRAIYCTFRGSFSSTARNCLGEEVRISGGRFQVTLQRAETRPDPGPFGPGGDTGPGAPPADDTGCPES